jgi:hypothetical protein
VCGSVYYYYYYYYYYYNSEVTVGTADKLLSGKCSMPCVVDVVDFVIIVDILYII